MMIKLFLITLLCATLVFAGSLVRDFQDEREKSVNGFLSMADHLMGRENSLVRRSAQGYGEGHESMGGGFAGGFAGGFGGGFGGEFGAGVQMKAGAEGGAGAGAGAGGDAEGEGQGG